MKVLLLLAGKSKRFWPLREKTLFPICGKTLLEHQVERLCAAGLDDIVLVGGNHNLEQAKELFPEFEIIKQEKIELGMRGALLSALPSCGKESVFIVCGNDVIDPQGYKDTLGVFEKDGVQGALLAQEVDSYFPGGYLTVGSDNRVTTIVEKPGEGNEPSNLVNIVAHIHDDASVLLDALGKVNEASDDGYEQALQKLFLDYNYQAVPHSGTWQAVKYPWHLLSLLPILLSEIKEQKIDPRSQIHESVVIKGNVIIEEDVKVMPEATIVGPCFIGKNSIVANGALVRGSSIGANCVIGYNTEVKDSILHSYVWTHMTYIGDSVIGKNVTFGGGCITGNLRLDEESISSLINGEKVNTGLTKFGTVIGNNCRIGIQVGINPGIKIGGGTFVSSGTLVPEDVGDEKFARIKDGVFTMSENKTKAPNPEAREEYRKKIEKQ